MFFISCYLQVSKPRLPPTPQLECIVLGQLEKCYTNWVVFVYVKNFLNKSMNNLKEIQRINGDWKFISNKKPFPLKRTTPPKSWSRKSWLFLPPALAGNVNNLISASALWCLTSAASCSTVERPGPWFPVQLLTSRMPPRLQLFSISSSQLSKGGS